MAGFFSHGTIKRRFFGHIPRAIPSRWMKGNKRGEPTWRTSRSWPGTGNGRSGPSQPQRRSTARCAAASPTTSCKAVLTRRSVSTTPGTGPGTPCRPSGPTVCGPTCAASYATCPSTAGGSDTAPSGAGEWRRWFWSWRSASPRCPARRSSGRPRRWPGRWSGGSRPWPRTSEICFSAATGAERR